MLVAMLLLGACQVSAGGFDRSLNAHVDYARTVAAAGDYDKAIAHADALLLGPSLTVGVKFESTSAKNVERCRQSLARVERAWELALRRELDFKFVEGGIADVTMTFQPKVVWNRKSVAGSIQWQRFVTRNMNGRYEHRVRADIRVRDNLSSDGIFHAVAHEIGHLLGLKDSRRGIMGPLNRSRPVTEIDERALASLEELRGPARTVRAYSLYALQADSLQTALSRLQQ